MTHSSLRVLFVVDIKCATLEWCRHAIVCAKCQNDDALHAARALRSHRRLPRPGARAPYLEHLQQQGLHRFPHHGL